MYAKTLKKTHRESYETTIRKRRLLLAGAVQRTKPERLTLWTSFWTMAGGETPGLCPPVMALARYLADDIAVFNDKQG